jgi:hypothetical protein
MGRREALSAKRGNLHRSATGGSRPPPGRSLDEAGPDSDTRSRPAADKAGKTQEGDMAKLRALFVALFRPYARAAAIRGGSGHYNEQCHPQTYG